MSPNAAKPGAVATTRWAPAPVRKTAEVTVVIPCYNYGRFLGAAVASCLIQSDVSVDVVIVDDCSTDDSLDVANGLAQKDGRVRVLANAANRGPVDTFNSGLAAAEGEFVVRLDADDLLTPGSLARAVAVMQAHPSVGLVYGHPIHFDDGGALPPHRDAVTSWLIWEGPTWLAARAADGSNVITSPEAVMRRSVTDRTGGQKDLPHAHDMEMWLRIAAYSDVAYVQGADQALHREHGASLSNEVANPIRALTEVSAAFEVLFDSVADSPADVGRLRAAARSALAREALDRAVKRTCGGSAEEVVALLQFARDREANSEGTRDWRTAAAGLDRRASNSRSPLQMLRGVPRRGVGWFRNRVRARRWRRTGMYERLAILSGPAR